MWVGAEEAVEEPPCSERVVSDRAASATPPPPPPPPPGVAVSAACGAARGVISCAPLARLLVLGAATFVAVGVAIVGATAALAFTCGGRIGSATCTAHAAGVTRTGGESAGTAHAAAGEVELTELTILGGRGDEAPWLRGDEAPPERGGK